MKYGNCVGRLLIVVLSAVSASAVSSDTSKPGGLSSTSDAGWPRQFTDGTAMLVLHEPQVDSWTDFRKLTARFAISLATRKNAQPVWGVLSIAADTDVNLDTQSVSLDNLSVTEIDYPSAKDDAQLKVWQALTNALLPQFPTTVALDRLLAYMEERDENIRQTEVQLTPPPILVSLQPAVLVIIDGKPILVDIEGTTLQKVVNTNWDLFFDQSGNQYYLRNDKTWLSARDLTSAWMPVTKLPKDFARLPADDAYKEVRDAAAKPHKSAVVPLVLVIDKPAELIVLAGQPVLSPVPGTQLMWVANTDCDLFLYSPAREYYFLTSGRWFRAPELKSDGWVAATKSLPQDFKNIPVDHPRAHVLAAVPGTRQAEEAILHASIPRIATIERKSARAEVKYVGDPKFEPIAGTGVSYAINSPNDVFHVSDQYYVCLDGVWFVSTQPIGPWVVTDDVPKEIYGITAESPKYHVTYVTVYESNEDTVTYGYTAGYSGVYIGYGVAMWGTGYFYPPYYAFGYYPYPVYWPCAYYTYGASAWYNSATGLYGRGSAVYGPYGGYARAAAYNPATGAYSWGRSAWGSYGAAASGGFYNPSTGAWGGGYRASNGYSSWGRSVVGKNGQWAGARSYSNSRGTVAGIETSAGGKAVAARGSQGQGFAAKSAAGDFYAGKDGNVYKRDQSGQWYKNNSGAWESVDRPSPAAGQANRADNFRSARPGGAQAAEATRESIQSGLNHDASARRWGDYNAQRLHSAPRNDSWSSGGFVGRNSSGWAARSPGFGRR